MKPDQQETEPPFNLPAQRVEQGQAPLEQFHATEAELPAVRATEQGVSTGPGQSTPQPPSQAPQQAPLIAADPAAGLAQGGPSASGMPQIADDVDLIEKEWVEKAKEIVEQTAHDPYLQNKEIIKVKMDYLKKRYNKDLKIDE